MELKIKLKTTFFTILAFLTFMMFVLLGFAVILYNNLNTDLIILFINSLNWFKMPLVELAVKDKCSNDEEAVIVNEAFETPFESLCLTDYNRKLNPYEKIIDPSLSKYIYNCKGPVLCGKRLNIYGHSIHESEGRICPLGFKQCAVSDKGNAICLPNSKLCPINFISFDKKDLVDTRKFLKINENITFVYSNEEINRTMVRDLYISENKPCIADKKRNSKSLIKKDYIKPFSFSEICQSFEEKVELTLLYELDLRYTESEDEFSKISKVFSVDFQSINDACLDIIENKYYKNLSDMQLFYMLNLEKLVKIVGNIVLILLIIFVCYLIYLIYDTIENQYDYENEIYEFSLYYPFLIYYGLINGALIYLIYSFNGAMQFKEIRQKGCLDIFTSTSLKLYYNQLDGINSFLLKLQFVMIGVPIFIIGFYLGMRFYFTMKQERVNSDEEINLKEDNKKIREIKKESKVTEINMKTISSV